MSAGPSGVVRYGLDSYRIAEGRFSISGWVVYLGSAVTNVHLVVVSESQELTHPATLDAPPKQLRLRFPEEKERGAGFWVSGRFSPVSDVRFRLQVRSMDGQQDEVELFSAKAGEELSGPPSAGQIRIGGIRLSRHRLKLGVSALRHGDPGIVLDKIRNDLRRRSEGSVDRVIRMLTEPRGASGVRMRRAENFFVETMRAAWDSSIGITVIIDHAMGGGANRYRDHLVRRSTASGHPTMTITPLSAELDVRAELVTQVGTAVLRSQDLGSIRDLLDLIPCDRLILNNAVSFDDPLAVVEVVLSLASRGVELVVNVHDYSSVCPSWALLDETGRYCGVPLEISRCETCLPRNEWEFLRLNTYSDIRSWRETWGRCLEVADRIVCFSASSPALLRRAYPGLDPEKVEVRPHVMDYELGPPPRLDGGSPLHIGVVGWMSYHKGRHIIEALAQRISDRALGIPITVFGSWDKPRVPQGIQVTGTYKPEDLSGLIELKGANVFLFPSVVPETFSYVCEELMHLKVPLAVFDIGAPPERVTDYEKGLVLDVADPDQILDSLIAFHRSLTRSGVE